MPLAPNEISEFLVHPPNIQTTTLTTYTFSVTEMSNKEKKRKRNPEPNEDRPNKRPATSLGSNIVKLKFVLEQDTLGPVLASTPGLVIPSNLEFTPYSKPRKAAPNRFKPVYSDAELLLHSASHPTVDYTAREGVTSQDDSLKHYIGIYDPDTAEASVVEIRTMSVRGNIRQKSPNAKNKPQTYQERKKDLIEAFGTKKSLKRQEDFETNVKLLGGPPPSEAMISATARNSQMTAIDKLEQERQGRQGKKPLPTPNMEATTASEAYPLTNLIENFDTTMTLLKVEPWRSAVKKDETITMTHRFPANRVVRIVQENKKNPQLIKALQYLLILLQVHSALKKPRGLNDNTSLPKDLNRLVPAAPTVAIIDSIKRKLTSSGQGHVLSTQSLILLRTTILALTLHIDNYTTDMRDIVKDLDMDVPTIQKYYRDLGCKPHKVTESEFVKYNVKTKAQANALKIFQLKVPLEFPKTRVKGFSSRKGY